MTISEFYDRTGGDYAGVLERFLQEERVEKFAKMFLDDPCCRDLENALARRDAKEAFRAVHTLKGVCMNLGFSVLYRSASDVTEALRGDDLELADTLMETLRRDYRQIVEALAAM